MAQGWVQAGQDQKQGWCSQQAGQVQRRCRAGLVRSAGHTEHLANGHAHARPARPTRAREPALPPARAPQRRSHHTHWSSLSASPACGRLRPRGWGLGCIRLAKIPSRGSNPALARSDSRGGEGGTTEGPWRVTCAVAPTACSRAGRHPASGGPHPASSRTRGVLHDGLCLGHARRRICCHPLLHQRGNLGVHILRGRSLRHSCERRVSMGWGGWVGLPALACRMTPGNVAPCRKQRPGCSAGAHACTLSRVACAT